MRIAVLVILTATSVIGCNKSEPGAATSQSAPAPKTEAAGKAIEVQQLSFADVLNKADDLVGTTAIVTAVSWGTSELKSGGKRLELGGERLSGFRMTELIAEFAPDAMADLEAIKRDDQVRIRCVIGPRDKDAETRTFTLTGCKAAK